MPKDLDTGKLVVKRLIAHQVPRRRKDDSSRQPILSEAVPSLPDSTLDFFCKRLKRTLQDRGHPVEKDPEQESPPLPPLIASYLNGDLDIVELSQRAANHLLTSQTGSPHEDECLFVVCNSLISSKQTIGIMKLEKEEGVHVTESKINNQLTLTVEVLNDLMLTDNTRLFKAGVFWLDRNTLYGYVSDTQQGAPSDVANYFLEKFLGCQFQRRPDILTQEFYNAVSEFINTKVTEAGDKLLYRAALQTEISSYKNTLDPMQFIADHFSTKHRSALQHHLQDSGIPDAAFPKDTSRISSRIKKSRLRTQRGITIAGNNEDMESLVRAEVRNNTSIIVIYDEVAEV